MGAGIGRYGGEVKVEKEFPAALLLIRWDFAYCMPSLPCPTGAKQKLANNNKSIKCETAGSRPLGNANAGHVLFYCDGILRLRPRRAPGENSQRR